MYANVNPIYYGNILAIYRQVSEWSVGAYLEQEFQLDDAKAKIISEGYATVVTKFACTLGMKTDFLDRDVPYAEFVCACLYLQRSHFRVSNTDIFVADPFLSLLPLASQLDEYGYNKNNFTTTKSCIQACIMDAIASGVNPGDLAFPVIPFKGLFL